MACCDAAQTLDAIRVRCIDLIPPVEGQRNPDPRVWICRICDARGEYPGFEHFKRCPVRDLHVPLAGSARRP